MYVTQEVAKPVMILSRNFCCSVAKKVEKDIPNETKKGTRVKNFQKEKKRKLPWNKNGIKYDLKYIHKKLSMNLQFRGENEHSLNINNTNKYYYQIRDYVCTFKR